MLPLSLLSIFFFFNDTATTEIYTLSLHDALPIYLTFSSGQILYSAAKRRRRAFQALHRSGVPLIKQVEEFKQHLSLHALADVEALGHSHIHVDKRRRSIDISRILHTLASEVETRSEERRVGKE